MENNQDFDFIKAQLSALPDVALPASLTAESLWARIDTGELTAEADAEPKQGKVVELIRSWRPVLSYAAVFVLMVAVYYGAGLNKAPGEMMKMDAPAPEAMPMAAPPAAPAAPAAAEETQQYRSSLMSEKSAEDTGDMVADALPQAATLYSLTAPETISYYQALTAELRGKGVTASVQEAGVRDGAALNHDMAVTDGKQLYMYEYIEGQPNQISIYSDKSRQQLGSFAVNGGRVIDLISTGSNLLVIEQAEDSAVLYAGDGMIPVEDSAGSATQLPNCGATMVTAYNVEDPQNVFEVYNFMQEGQYLSHRWIDNRLVMASQKLIDLPESGTVLCNVAPMIATQNNSFYAVMPTRYPEGEPNEYLVLSSVWNPDAAGWDANTVAVLGSRLDVQLSGKVAFVLSADAKAASKPFESLPLGNITVELR
ncbi:MAG: beta-propeller domain-containing protein [Angelakisella sp.]